MSAFFGAIVGVIIVTIVFVIAIVIWALDHSINKSKNEKKSNSWSSSYSDYAKKSKTFNGVSHEEFADLESKLYKSNEDQLTFSDNILKEIEELKERLSKLENTEEKGE